MIIVRDPIREPRLISVMNSLVEAFEKVSIHDFQFRENQILEFLKYDFDQMADHFIEANTLYFDGESCEMENEGCPNYMEEITYIFDEYFQKESIDKDELRYISRLMYIYLTKEVDCYNLFLEELENKVYPINIERKAVVIYVDDYLSYLKNLAI